MNHDGQEIRLSGTSFAVLGLVQMLEEATPYQLKAALEVSVANFWPLPHTTFYAEPARLAEAGYLTENQEQGGRRRKLYRLTDKGSRALTDWAASTEFNAPQQRDEQMLKIFLGADPAPLLEASLEWHRSKLAELEGYLAEVRATGEAQGFGSVGAKRTLISGTLLHQTLATALARLLDEGFDALETESGGDRDTASPAGPGQAP